MPSTTPTENVLVTLSGPQQPDSLSKVLEILGNHPLSDFGQLVIHNRFIATALLSSPKARDTVKDALFRAHSLGVSIDFNVVNKDAKVVDVAKDADGDVYVVSLIEEGDVKFDILSQILALIVGDGGSVLGIQRLSGEGEEFMCVEMRATFGEGDVGVLRRRLFEIGKREISCDLAIQKENVMRKAKRLVVFDLSWTLVQGDAVGIVLQAAGVDCSEAGLEERVERLKGVDIDGVMKRLGQYMTYTRGAIDLCKGLKKLGCKLAVVSSGAKIAAERAKEGLGLDYAFGNVFEKDGAGKFTGRVVQPVVDKERKKELVCMLAMQERIDMEQVVVVGDGPVSAKMLEVAGMGVAFDQPVSTDEVWGGRIGSRSLMGVLYLLGVGGGELREVMRE